MWEMSGHVNARDRMEGEGFPAFGNCDSPSSTNPLKLFGEAKKRINDIFGHLHRYIEDCGKILSEIKVGSGIVQRENAREVASSASKVDGIWEILKRDRMKVVFFGRTSNGKSTTINAMLKANILPTGIGHTTHCFLQVEGTSSNKACLLTEDSTIPKSIQSVSQLASALSTVKLEANSLIRICWPKSSCHLLQNDVVIVDSPGVDISPDLDLWIDKFCLDADVFILVANAESTLMQTEKNFFHKVSSKLSKPNVFILNNRWDASAGEPDKTIQEVKAQHLQRCISFMVDEMKVSDRIEAEERVFFVSAREALASRVNSEQGTTTPNSMLLEGFQGRMFEFVNFEKKFQECLSHSAVQTRFAQHAFSGKTTLAEMKAIVEEVCSSADIKSGECRNSYSEKEKKLEHVETQLSVLTSVMKEKILAISEQVQQKVSASLNDEIRKLGLLIDDFDGNFDPEETTLAKYKQDLHYYVEDTVSRNLHARCSSFMHQIVEDSHQQMQDQLMSLLPENTQVSSLHFLPSHNFEIAYRLDCKNLCADFAEDIRFQFTLGIVSLMNRFVGQKGRQHMARGYNNVPYPMSSASPQTPGGTDAAFSLNTDLMSGDATALLRMFTSLYSGATIGALALTGLVARAIGWRVIAVCGAVYGLLYVYERLMWTNKAMEKTFKRQYVEYASAKLKLILEITSSNCAHQIQQELQSTFARLCHLVNNSKLDLEKSLHSLESEIADLERTMKRVKDMRNAAGYVDSELNSFIQQYLNAESRI